MLGAVDEIDEHGVFRTIHGRSIFWVDADGVTHACRGADVHRAVRMIWTDCGKDVPANAAFLAGHADVDCPGCAGVYS